MARGAGRSSIGSPGGSRLALAMRQELADNCHVSDSGSFRSDKHVSGFGPGSTD